MKYDIIGMRDIQSAQRDMNGLSPVTTEIAKILLQGGQDAITGAIAGAKQPWYKSDLPGNSARDNVMWKLRWHADQLGKLPSSATAIYASASDLKQWVMQAFIEANAVEEGAAYLDVAWDKMWTGIKSGLANAAKAGLAVTASAAGSVLSTAAGALVPTWLWVVGGIAVAGAASVGVYKLVRAVRK